MASVENTTEREARVRARIGIVTISDRVSRGEASDRGGPAIREFLDQVLTTPYEPIERLVADERPEVAAVLRELSDAEPCSLVLTTGGTGPAVRDVTPEATVDVCRKLLPGFGERMRAVSVGAVPTAILSRQVAGIRGTTLIINLPGSPRAIAECLRAVFPAVPHCVELLGGPRMRTNPDNVRTFDPGHR